MHLPTEYYNGGNMPICPSMNWQPPYTTCTKLMIYFVSQANHTNKDADLFFFFDKRNSQNRKFRTAFDALSCFLARTAAPLFSC